METLKQAIFILEDFSKIDDIQYYLSLNNIELIKYNTSEKYYMFMVKVNDTQEHNIKKIVDKYNYDFKNDFYSICDKIIIQIMNFF